jgi:hypothetical protein
MTAGANVDPQAAPRCSLHADRFRSLISAMATAGIEAATLAVLANVNTSIEAVDHIRQSRPRRHCGESWVGIFGRRYTARPVPGPP